MKHNRLLKNFMLVMVRQTNLFKHLFKCFSKLKINCQNGKSPSLPKYDKKDLMNISNGKFTMRKILPFISPTVMIQLLN